MTVCGHLDQIRVTELPAPIAGCEDCLKIGSSWVHLRMCMTCGKIGCCDSSPNRHASRHARRPAPDRPLRRGGRGLELVLRRRGRFHGRARMSAVRADLPHLPLPLEGWEATKNTLHLWVQIVGKVRMASSPPRNHWWHVAALRRRARTDDSAASARRNGVAASEIDFDFVDHRLVVATSDGARRLVRARRRALRLPSSTSGCTRRSRGSASTSRSASRLRPADHDAVPGRPRARRVRPRRGRALLAHPRWTDGVLEEFAGWFCGKTSPVHLFWHSFDLAVTRFNGARERRSTPDADPVTQEAYSHELVSFGFWAGDENVPRADLLLVHGARAGRAASATAGTGRRALGRSGLGLMRDPPYDAVRSSPDPRATLLAFLESAYRAGAGAAGWDTAALDVVLVPGPAPFRDALTRPDRARTAGSGTP